MDELENASVIGRLAEEISWEGKKVRAYRQGGRGMENVLTTEVLLPLSYLPRAAFLGSVLARAHGAKDHLPVLAAEAEQGELSLLPGDLAIGRNPVNVQPDATLTTPSAFALVEAKRIRRSSFQVEQLAREYLAVLQEAGDRSPVLLLLLGSAPPVRIKKLGVMHPVEAIRTTLPEVHGRTQCQGGLDAALEQVEAVVAWTTWADMAEVVREKREAFLSAADGLSGTVSRLSTSMLQAIEWHS